MEEQKKLTQKKRSTNVFVNNTDPKKKEQKKIKTKKINPGWELSPRTTGVSTHIATTRVYLEASKCLRVNNIYLH